MSVISLSLAKCSTSFKSWAVGTPARGFLILGGERVSRHTRHEDKIDELCSDVPVKVDGSATPLGIALVSLSRGSAPLLDVGHGARRGEKRRPPVKEAQWAYMY